MGSEQPARPDLWNGDALEGVNEQHFGDEVSGPRGQVAGQVVDATLDLLEQVGDVLVIKGQTATQQSIQDDAAAPYIYFWAAIQLARDDLKAQQTGNHCCDSKMMQMISSTVYYVVPGVQQKDHCSVISFQVWERNALPDPQNRGAINPRWGQNLG